MSDPVFEQVESPYSKRPVTTIPWVGQVVQKIAVQSDVGNTNANYSHWMPWFSQFSVLKQLLHYCPGHSSLIPDFLDPHVMLAKPTPLDGSCLPPMVVSLALQSSDRVLVLPSMPCSGGLAATCRLSRLMA